MKRPDHVAKSAREAALFILLETGDAGDPREVTARIFGAGDFSPRDRALVNELVRGVFERRLTLDFVLNSLSKTPVRRMKPLVREDLRLAVFQILFLDRIPDRAAVNEAVSLAAAHGFSGLKGFVNGVLRNVSRQKEAFLSEIASSEDPEVRFSVPSFVFSTLAADYGREKAADICSAFSDRLDVSALVLTSRTDRESLLGTLSDEGFSVTADDEIAGAFSVSNAAEGKGLTETAAFKDGLFYIMDRSSMADGLKLQAAIQGLQEGGISVLDLCGAPGGKAIHAADILAGRGTVLARDVTAAKVSLIENNIRRTRLENIFAEVGDATLFDPASEEAYDVVICDIPCSGLGVMGRKPLIRYRQSEESMAGIDALQEQILKNAVTYPKKGGFLIYSTCTLRKAENEGRRAEIEAAGYRLLSEDTAFPDEGKGGGFYSALLQRMK